MSSSSVSNINSKYCSYGCNTKIYWNTLKSEYVEVSTNEKHYCPNRLNNSNKSVGSGVNNNNNPSSKSTVFKDNPMNQYCNKNNYNYKKNWPNYSNKHPMDNSVEILQGSADTVTKQYEILTDLIKKYKGKTHGSQSHILQNNSLQIVVYYEVLEGMRDEVKIMFETCVRDKIEIHK